jgi:hypothetical protein
VLNQKEPVTHEEIIELLSPRKKKKKAEDISQDLIQRILFGLNIIRKDEVDHEGCKKEKC